MNKYSKIILSRKMIKEASKALRELIENNDTRLEASVDWRETAKFLDRYKSLKGYAPQRGDDGYYVRHPSPNDVFYQHGIDLGLYFNDDEMYKRLKKQYRLDRNKAAFSKKKYKYRFNKAEELWTMLGISGLNFHLGDNLNAEKHKPVSETKDLEETWKENYDKIDELNEVLEGFEKDSEEAKGVLEEIERLKSENKDLMDKIRSEHDGGGGTQSSFVGRSKTIISSRDFSQVRFPIELPFTSWSSRELSAYLKNTKDLDAEKELLSRS